MREVGVHDDDIVSCDELKTMYVCRSKTKLAFPRLQDNVWGICFHELIGDDLCAVRAAIVDDYEFPVQLPIASRLVS